MARRLTALVDDGATILDGVAWLLGQGRVRKAQQVRGAGAVGESPLLWAGVQGAMLSKPVLVPAALARSMALARLA